MTDIAHYMEASFAAAEARDGASVVKTMPTIALARPSLDNKPSLDMTFAFIERAAETLRSLQKDNEAARRQINDLREKLQLEKQGRHADADRFNHFLSATQRKVAASEAQIVEAKGLAINAIKRCEDMAAREAASLQRARLAETKAADLEQSLQSLQKAIVFEFSSVLS